MRKLLFATMAVILLFLGCPAETEVASISVSPSTASITMSETQQFTATAYDADNNEITDAEFTWSSSDTTVATVSSSGLATPVAAGPCTITAASGDVEGTAALTVTSGPTYHSGTISADETWYASGNPHIIEDDVGVQDNATLTIEAGCIVRFEPVCELYAGYYGAGAIIANGTASAPILFTSNVSTPAAGDWVRIGLYDLTMSTTSFSYCTIEYGGSNTNDGMFYADGITSVKVSYCTLRYSQYCGVYISSTTAFTTFANNTISNCGTYPLHINAEYVRTIGSGNILTGNTIDAIEVSTGTVHTSGTWINPGVPYVIDNIEIGDNSTSPVITIAPGNTIKFLPGSYIDVGYYELGGLIADGTSDRITFTSNNASPAPGDFADIGFYDLSIDASSQLINCTIEYGGDYTGASDGNIYIENSLPTIDSDSIGNSISWGIFTFGTHPDPDTLLAHNTFYNNAAGNVGP